MEMKGGWGTVFKSPIPMRLYTRQPEIVVEEETFMKVILSVVQSGVILVADHAERYVLCRFCIEACQVSKIRGLYTFMRAKTYVLGHLPC